MIIFAIIMKQTITLLLLCLIFFGFKNGETEQEVYKSENLIITKISEHAYRHITYLNTVDYGKVPCNGMIAFYKNEAVVFDTPTDDKTSSELIDWITKKQGFKIKAVIPTHYHADNLGGLEEFHRHGIPSYAYKKTIEIVKNHNLPIPQNSFDSILTLKIGNKKIYAEFIGEGHTCDNIIGYFPLDKIMFGGCLVKENGAGKGNLAEASPDKWSETVSKVRVKYPETMIIIPGHGKPGGKELFDYTIRLFK
jgi:metallo-beta-lactamase class B